MKDLNCSKVGVSHRIGNERGVIAILLPVFLVLLIGFAALVIDLGNLIIVKGELQNAADAGALAGVIDLVYEDETAAQATAVAFTTQPSNYRLAGSPPGPDAVEVVALDSETLRVRARRAAGTSAGPVNTIFARIWGIQAVDVEAVAVATMNRRIIGTGPDNLMPFGINRDFVEADDGGNYDIGNTVDIYPHDYAPGNFGLLDLNGGSNSNDETRDWIENGYDGVFIIPEDPGYVLVEGDPGISGESLDDAISSRLNERVVFLVFDQVTGHGDNTIFRVVGLMGGIIRSFKLNGPQDQRNLMVEIADFTANNLNAGDPSVPDNNSLGFPVLVR